MNIHPSLSVSKSMQTKTPFVTWNSTRPADLPAGMGWLSDSEIERYERFKFPKRRAEWLLGRWAAKRLLASCLNEIEPDQYSFLSIESAVGGAPYAVWKGMTLSGCLSISHRADLAAAAWCLIENSRVGIDIELIEFKSATFIQDYFTQQEAALVFAQPTEHHALAASLVWSAKEALLKALQTGLSIDTRQVEVSLDPIVMDEDWQPLSIVRIPSQAKKQSLSWLFQPPYLITLATLHD